MSLDSPETLASLRAMIAQSAAETSLVDAHYDYGHLNGWMDALFYTAIISGETLYSLRNEASQAFEHAVAGLNASVSSHSETADPKEHSS